MRSPSAAHFAFVAYSSKRVKRPTIVTALLITTSGLLVLVAIWFALNHFRVEYYNSAMEGPAAETSPYWTIIRIQNILAWPIFLFAGLSGFLVLIKLVSKLSAVFRSDSGKL
jgi:hypothetical protein